MFPFHPHLRRILWFSRGFGRGHAVKDVAILERLRTMRADFDVRFVSYGTGARTLDHLGYAVIDLGLPDQNPYLETLVRAGNLIDQLTPELVVAHEEFAAPVAAGVFGLPCVFITHWFWMEAVLWMESLAYTDEILFIEEPDVFEEPPWVRGRVRYVGPVLRSFTYGPEDRRRARQELGLPEKAVVICVLSGSWTEAVAPIFDLVVPAYDALAVPEKRMVWIAGRDAAWLEHRLAERTDVTVKEVDWQLDRLMVASDLAITKGTYTTLRELGALGVPSISLSHGINPIDSIWARHVPTNWALEAKEATAAEVAGAIAETLAKGSDRRAVAFRDGARGAAKRLDWWLSRVATAEARATAG